MLPIIETLNFDDKEVFWQVMTEALEQMTNMQRQCLLMSIIGLEQSVISRILKIDQSNVSRNFANALEIIGVIAREYV